ncbi:alpha/beta hydrolase [Actinopolymorpha sp. B17G11]|uniref:alpha/beta fold hydrolase n=1 Tax=unclassified Actinopolymorpha TaxID=2627063 RepID=UPI0032D95366
MSKVTLDGITVGYTDEGSGEPLVLVHGHPFDRSMWQPQVAHFSRQGWRVIVPDLRGYGESTVVPGLTTLETFARDIAHLLEHLGIGHHVIGGLSMGGQIVMEYYRLFPDRVRALLLADTFAAGETEHGKKVRNDTADRVLREGMEGYATELLPGMVAQRTLEAMPEVAAHVLGMMRRTSPAGAAAALRGRAERRDYVDMLARISVPTLVVVGSADEFTPVSDARLIQERIPDATLAIVDGVGHMPNLERPGEFNAAFEKLLHSLPRTA